MTDDTDRNERRFKALVTGLAVLFLAGALGLVGALFYLDQPERTDAHQIDPGY